MDNENYEFLKKAWAVPPDAIRSPSQLRTALAVRVRSLQNGVLRTILSEIAGVGAIYGPVLLILFVADSRFRSFHLTALFISFIGSLRLMGDLIQALRWGIRNDVLSLPVLENLLRTIGEQERWIRFYRKFVPITCAALAVFLLCDVGFRTLPLGWNTAVLLYIALVVVVIRPYLTRLYGRRVAEIKRQFRDWTGD